MSALHRLTLFAFIFVCIQAHAEGISADDMGAVEIRGVGSYDEAVFEAKKQLQTDISKYGVDSVTIPLVLDGYASQLKGQEMARFYAEIQQDFPNVNLDQPVFEKRNLKYSVTDKNGVYPVCVMFNNWYTNPRAGFLTPQISWGEGEQDFNVLFEALRHHNTDVTCDGRYLNDEIKDALDFIRNTPYAKTHKNFERDAAKLQSLFTQKQSEKTKKSLSVLCAEVKKYKDEILKDLSNLPRVIALTCGKCLEVDNSYNKSVRLYRQQLQASQVKPSGSAIFEDFNYPADCNLYVTITPTAASSMKSNVQKPAPK